MNIFSSTISLHNREKKAANEMLIKNYKKKINLDQCTALMHTRI